VAQQRENAVADHVDGGLVPGHEQQCGSAHQLVGRQVGRDQVADQVVVGVRAAVRGEVAQGVDELPRCRLCPAAPRLARIGLVHRDDRRRPGAQAGAHGGREAEQVSDHLDRKHVRDARHDVGRPLVPNPRGEVGDEPVRQRTHPRLQPPGVPAVEDAGDERAQPVVRLALALEQGVAVQQVERGERLRRLRVRPDPPQVPPAQHLRARGVRDGDRDPEQRVLVDRPEGAQGGEGGVRIIEEVGVGGVERHRVRLRQ
jgi:hypothetical protein